MVVCLENIDFSRTVFSPELLRRRLRAHNAGTWVTLYNPCEKGGDEGMSDNDLKISVLRDSIETVAMPEFRVVEVSSA